MSKARAIAEALRHRRKDWLPPVFPNGQIRGGIFLIGDADGSPGKSFPIPLDPAKGAGLRDFGNGFKGDDLDLFARGMRQNRAEAMRTANEMFGLGIELDQRDRSKTRKSNGHRRAETAAPPGNAHNPPPPARHPKLGEPSSRYEYHDADGELIMVMCRWEKDHPQNDTGRKQFRPLHLDGAKWRWQDPDGLLPLYRLPDLIAHPDKPVLVHEGEKKVDVALELLPEFASTTWPHGANGDECADFSPLQGSHCILIPDADNAGREAMRRVAGRLLGLGAPTVRIAEPLHELGEGADVANIVTAEHVDLMQDKIAKAKDAKTARFESFGIISADELLATVFGPVRWILEPYLTEGLAVLAGKPKIGKSWLALGIACPVAAGATALGTLQVAQGDVLYMALEDNPRRLQARLRAVLQGAEAPPSLHLVTEWNRLDEGGIDDLRLWLEDHPDARLIVIDTLAKVRARRRPNGDIYAEDYDAVSGLKRLADEFGIAIVLVHHLRKTPSDDVVDEVSGSTGLTGAVDTILILKRDRSAADAVLFATGRDVEEVEDALEFDGETGRWTKVGDAETYRRSKEQMKIVRALQQAGEPMGPKEIAEATRLPHASVRQLVRKLAKDGVIGSVGKGKYEALK